MNSGALLRRSRLQAGLSQRDLARTTGVAQPAIARIEAGDVTPRVDTLDRLLAGCGKELRVEDRPGIGVDRTVIRQLLKLTPEQRLELAVEEAHRMADFERAVRR